MSLLFAKTFRFFIFVFIVISLAACGSSGSTSEASQSFSRSDIQAIESHNAEQTESTSGDEAQLCVVSDFEQTLLDEINSARSIPQQCGDQIYPATTPLSWSCDLEQAAVSHSVDMTDNNFFSHTGSDGLNVGHRVDQTNYRWARVGENLAAGYATIDSAVAAWIDSPSHCAALMNGQYEETGLGVIYAENTDFQIYWTMVLGLEI